MPREQRRLAAIVSADVAGYSRLMGRDESGTLAALKALRREVVDPRIKAHRGRIVKTTGDGLLLEFASVVDAMRCVTGVQSALADRNADIAPDNRIEFRIGVNIGDVIIDDKDIFGDGVNVAARLQELAAPGGICVSGRVHEDVRDRLDVAFADLGEQTLKNIVRPVRVYRVLPAGAAAPSRVPPSLPDKPSIAVLPFQNLSTDADQEYFADGVVEDIITALSHTPWLFVIARNSSFTYKGRAVDVKQVGRELGVRYVLEGSIRRAASRVRITGQLVETASGAHVWADRFEGSLEDIFALQDQMTGRIINALLPNLFRVETERTRRKPTESLDAYELYLRALASPPTREGVDGAIALFRRVTELDGNFAAAYGWAAFNYALRSKVYRWTTDTEQDIAEVDRLARRAVAVGQNDAIALGHAGMALALVVGDLDAGAMYVARALSLNPNAAYNWQHSGWIHVWLGRLDIAIDNFQQAMRLSPLDPWSFSMATGTAFAHFFAGRDDQASQWAGKVMQERPDFHLGLSIGAAAAAMDGRTEEAGRLCARLQAVDPALRLSNLSAMFAPYRNPQHPARWIEGLRRAGLPE